MSLPTPRPSSSAKGTDLMEKQTREPLPVPGTFVSPDSGDSFGKLVLLVHEMIPQWLEILYRPTLNG